MPVPPTEREDAAARIVLLAGEGDSSRIVYHALASAFGSVNAIIEEPIPKIGLLKRRLRRLGPVTVAGQILFQSAVVPILQKRSGARVAAIKRENGLNDAPFPDDVVRVSSANSDEARDALRRFNPAVVVVNGTRIIAKRTLQCVPAVFINTHAGITPLYRGVHGGYWALADGRPDLVGTTVHRVDEGIDTGAVLGQVTFAVNRNDNFATYPYLHIAAGVPILLRTVSDALESKLQDVTVREALPSKLRSHPTIAGYLYRRWKRGIR